MKYQAIDSDYIREMKERDEFLKQKNMMYKGLKYGYYTAIIIIILSAFFSGNLVLAQTSNIDYDFQNGYAYNGVLPESSVLVNQRYTTEPTGHFPATYSFENDTIGSVPEGWVELYGNISVISDYQEHSKVVLLNDTTTISTQMTQNLDPRPISGTIEFWINVNQTDKLCYMFLYNGWPEKIFVLRIEMTGEFKIQHGGGTTKIGDYVANKWYHFRFDFECDVGGYMGLGNDTFDGYLNGVLVADEWSSIDVGDELLYVHFMTHSTQLDILYYIDAIGCSWDKTHYSETSFDVGSEDGEPCGIAWDGTNFWISGLQTSDVYQYTDAGVYTTTHYDVGSEDIYPQGIAWDGTNFWIVGSQTDEVYKYTDAWVYTGVHFDTSSESTYPNGIAWDGNDFWITDGDDDEVYKYNSSGVYTGVSFDTSSESTGSADITYTGNYFLVIGYDNEMVYRYTLSGVYTGLYFDYSNEDFAMEGITWDGSSVWLSGLLNTDVYKYTYVENPYNIEDNLQSTVGLSNNTETDKFEFTHDSSANINVNGDDDVSGFTDIENDFWSNDVVNVIDSVDDDVDKAIRILRAQLGNCGIQRDFDVGVNTSEVSWQLDLVQLGYPECQVYAKIENADSDIIAFFMLNGSYFPYGAYSRVMELSYYYNSEWVLLESGIASGNNYNMTFNLNWTNGDGFGVLGFDGDTYPILFENDQDSLGIFEIYAINDHNVIYNSIDIEIDWVRIIVNGSSLSDELMPDNMFILTGEDVSLLYQPFIEITFDISVDNNVSIYLNDDIQLIDYTYNVTAERIFFTNAHQDKSYSGLFLKIYNSTSYNIENIKVYGVQLINQQDSSDNPFLEFDYSNVDPNISYFFVSGNDLYYHLETDDNGNLEYIQATFNINDFTTEGYAVAFSHQKGTTYLQSECKVVFTDNTYLSFISSNTTQAEGLIMPQDKTIKELVFLITDDNNGIIDASDGYFSEVSFIFYPDIATTLTTLSLIEVLPIIILLTAVPIAIYYGFGKKKELIVPSLALMSIFATGVGLIPIWLEVIIIFSCVAYYVIRQKSGGI